MHPRSAKLKRLFDLARNRIRTARHPHVRVSDPPEGIRVEWDVAIVVRDGTTLRANVFRPENEATVVPAILSAHPYNKDLIPFKTPSGHEPSLQYHVFPQPDPIEFSAYTSWEAPDPGVWVPLGYAVVNIDLRGGGTSEGEADLLSDQEAEDYFDAIEWVAAQPWCTGKVGLEGVSYLAISQYKAAALRPPHLCAICPWEGFSDVYRDFVRPGGIRERGFSVFWSKATRRVARVKSDLLSGFRSRADRDAWYEALTPRLEAIEVPMLVCGSFSDHSLHSRGSFEAFRRAGSAQKWLYTHRGGKWSTFYADETKAVRRRFFDHFLKGVDNGWDEESPVRLAIYAGGSQAESVVTEAAWPPADVGWRELFLDGETGWLEDQAPAVAVSQRFEVPAAELTFQWEVPEEMDLLGPMALRLFVEMREGDDAFFFVGVRKFRGDDEVCFEGSYGFAGDMVTRGWQRASHRQLDEGLSTAYRPVHTFRRREPLRPGEIVPVDIALLDQATRFRPGDVLQLEVRGHWPFSRNPLSGQFPVGYEASPRGVARLYSGGDKASRLLVGTRVKGR